MELAPKPLETVIMNDSSSEKLSIASQVSERVSLISIFAFDVSLIL